MRHAVTGRGKMLTNPDGNHGMGMLDGISQCWWLSKTCAVNWEAWAATGTVLAVFVAILAPAIQRRFFLRKKANAVFAVSYWADIVTGRIAIERILTEFPLNENGPVRSDLERKLKANQEDRLSFRTFTEKLAPLCSRELDGSKWPAVDLDIVLAVAEAIHAAGDIVRVGNVMVDGNTEKRDWPTMLTLFRENIDDSLHAIRAAEKHLIKVRNGPRRKIAN